MYRITSQLCEVFNCTNQQLETTELLNKFSEWLTEHPEIVVSHDIETGEIINREIAVKFKKTITF